MQAYLNDEKVKGKYLARVQAHAAADKIVKGQYWSNGKGCAVGCTIEGSDHGKYETELGIPRAIARLEDRIFEGLPNAEAMTFPSRFLEAVNVGADLSMVVPKFFVWLLGDEKDGVINFVGEYKKCEKAIRQVHALYVETVGGKIVEKQTWKDAYAAYDAAAYAAAADAAAAAAAAAYAAYAAAYADAAAAYAADAAAAAAAYAADAAAYAADAADAAAADAAADAYAQKTAKEKYYSKMANKLLEILKETK